MSITDPGYSPDRYAPKPPEEQVDIPQDGQDPAVGQQAGARFGRQPHDCLTTVSAGTRCTRGLRPERALFPISASSARARRPISA